MGSKKQDPNAAAAESLREQSQANVEAALDQYKNMTPLQRSDFMYEIDVPELVGLLEAQDLEKSRMEGIETDKELSDAQKDTLQFLQKMGAEGLTSEDLAVLGEVKRQTDAQNQSRQAAIKQELAQRGVLGSGQEIAMRQSAAQDAANRANQQAMQVAAQNQQARRDALSRAGQMAGSMEQAQFGREATKASAADLVNKANWANRQGVQAQNLAAQQQMANAQSQIQTAQNKQGSDARLGVYNADMQLAGAKAGTLTGQAQMLQNQANTLMANSNPSKGSPLKPMLAGAGSGAAIGTSINPGWGTAIGAGVGAMAGLAQHQMAADGGIMGGYNSTLSPTELQLLEENERLRNNRQRYSGQNPMDTMSLSNQYNSSQLTMSPQTTVQAEASLTPVENLDTSASQTERTANMTPAQDLQTDTNLEQTSMMENSDSSGGGGSGMSLAQGLQAAGMLSSLLGSKKETKRAAPQQIKVDFSPTKFKPITLANTYEDGGVQFKNSREKFLGNERFDRDNRDYINTMAKLYENKPTAEPKRYPARSGEASALFDELVLGKKSPDNYVDARKYNLPESKESSRAMLDILDSNYGVRTNKDDNLVMALNKDEQATADRYSKLGALGSYLMDKDSNKKMKGQELDQEDIDDFANEKRAERIRQALDQEDIDDFANEKPEKKANKKGMTGKEKGQLAASILGAVGKITAPKKDEKYVIPSQIKADFSPQLFKAITRVKDGGIVNYEDGGVAQLQKSLKGFNLGSEFGQNSTTGNGLEFSRHASVENFEDVFGAGLSQEEKSYFKAVCDVEKMKFAEGGKVTKLVDKADPGIKETIRNVVVKPDSADYAGLGRKGLTNKYKCGGTVHKYSEGGIEALSQEEIDAIARLDDQESLKDKIAEERQMKKHYNLGGIPEEGYDSDLDEEVIDGDSYVGDRVDAKVNSGEMVLNLEQQQRLMELLKGERELDEMPDEDIIRPSKDEETNLHEENQMLKAKLAALTKLGE